MFQMIVITYSRFVAFIKRVTSFSVHGQVDLRYVCTACVAVSLTPGKPRQGEPSNCVSSLFLLCIKNAFK